MGLGVHVVVGQGWRCTLAVLFLAVAPASSSNGFCSKRGGTSRCCHAQTHGSCDEELVGRLLGRSFERLGYEFDKCSSCLDLWHEVLCAASCSASHVKSSFINGAAATDNITLSISPEVCGALYDACADDDTLGKKLIWDQYDGDLANFCEFVDIDERIPKSPAAFTAKARQEDWIRGCSQWGAVVIGGAILSALTLVLLIRQIVDEKQKRRSVDWAEVTSPSTDGRSSPGGSPTKKTGHHSKSYRLGCAFMYFSGIASGLSLLLVGCFNLSSYYRDPTYEEEAMDEVPRKIFAGLMCMFVGAGSGAASLTFLPLVYNTFHHYTAKEGAVVSHLAMLKTLSPWLGCLVTTFVCISFSIDYYKAIDSIVTAHFMSFFDSSAFLVGDAQTRLDWIDRDGCAAQPDTCRTESLYIKVGSAYCDKDEKCMTLRSLQNYTETMGGQHRTDFHFHPKPFCFLDKHDANFEGAVVLLVMISVLWMGLTSSNFIKSVQWDRVTPSMLYIVFGMAVASFGVYSGAVQEGELIFPTSFFQFLLLPPIVFKTGYCFQVSHLSATVINTVLAMAVFGTLITTFFLGCTLYVCANVPAVFHFPALKFSESMLLGSILSAVDPVATLGLFASLGVEPKLETIIEGESLINDALAIILFKTFASMQYEPEVQLKEHTLRTITGLFEITAGSILVGIAVGAGSALFFKCISFRGNSDAELIIFFLFAYTSFLCAEHMHLSGILSTLVCGFMMAVYTNHNLSTRGAKSTKTIAGVLSSFTEVILFVISGSSMVLQIHYLNWFFAIITLLLCFVARAITVFPICSLLNKMTLVTGSREGVPQNYQVVMWFAGLRGAIAIGLSTQIPSKYRREMSAVISFIVLTTVVFLGGSTAFILKQQKIQCGLHNDSHAKHKHQADDHKRTIARGRCKKLDASLHEASNFMSLFETLVLFNINVLKPLLCKDFHHYTRKGVDLKIKVVEFKQLHDMCEHVGEVGRLWTRNKPYAVIYFNQEMVHRTAGQSHKLDVVFPASDPASKVHCPPRVEPYIRSSELVVEVGVEYVITCIRPCRD
jgi:sodium/hydrogen exchanger 3